MSSYPKNDDRSSPGTIPETVNGAADNERRHENPGLGYIECDLEVSEDLDAQPSKGRNIYGENEYHLTVQEFIERRDKERAAHVARRRANLNAFQRVLSKFVPYGGLLASSFSLTSSSIGAGIICLPSAFQMSGIFMALVNLVVLGLLTVYSYTLLAVAGRKTGLRNYEQVVKATMGTGMDYFLGFCMWFLGFGTEVSYVISIGDVIATFLDHASNVPSLLTKKSGRRLITVLVWLCFMYPLTLPREINSLRYFSVIAIFLMIYFVFSMVVHSFQNGLKDGLRDDIVYFQTGNGAIQGLAIFMASYLSQLNCYEVYGELYKPSVRRLTISGGISAGVCFFLYTLAGLFGYLDFGAAVTGSALNLYNPIKEPMMGISYGIIVVKLCIGYGLNMIQVREAIYHVMKVQTKTIVWWKHALIITSMATLSLLGGLFMPRVNTAIGLVGGFSGGFISYIFPALMCMYSGNWSLKSMGWFHYVMTYLMLIIGVVGVVFGTLSTIYAEFVA